MFYNTDVQIIYLLYFLPFMYYLQTFSQFSLLSTATVVFDELIFISILLVASHNLIFKSFDFSANTISSAYSSMFVFLLTSLQVDQHFKQPEEHPASLSYAPFNIELCAKHLFLHMLCCNHIPLLLHSAANLQHKRFHNSSLLYN